MTNYEQIKSASPQQREEYEKLYREHPLAKYIDWKKYFESDDGNEMHFVNALHVYKDENGKTNYILEKKQIDNLDYYLAYIAEDNQFVELPVK